MDKINNRQEKLFQVDLKLKSDTDYNDYENFSTKEKKYIINNISIHGIVSLAKHFNISEKRMYEHYSSISNEFNIENKLKKMPTFVHYKDLNNEHKKYILNNMDTIGYIKLADEYNINKRTVHKWYSKIKKEFSKSNSEIKKEFSKSNSVKNNFRFKGLTDEEKNTLVSDFKLSLNNEVDRQKFLNKYSKKYNRTKDTIMYYVRNILKERGENVEEYSKKYKSLFYRLTNEEKEIFLNDFYNRTDHKVFYDTYISKWGVTKRTIRDYVNRLLPEGKVVSDYPINNNNNKGISQIIDEQMANAKKPLIQNAVYFISGAQCHTLVHEQLLQNMEVYAKYKNAIIYIIPYQTNNPRVIRQVEGWDERIREYLNSSNMIINNVINYIGDINILPTAKNPLTGLVPFSGDEEIKTHVIIGSPKYHIETLKRFESFEKQPINNILTLRSSLSITQPNYSNQKNNYIAELHHTNGFNIIEFDENGVAFIRDISCDKETGSFYDLDVLVEDGVVKKNNEISGMVVGDIHSGNQEVGVLDATISMIKDLKIKDVVLHDVMDGSSINHHEGYDITKKLNNSIIGADSLEDELADVDDVINQFLNIKDISLHFAKSNHDDFINKWLNQVKSHVNAGVNALYYLNFSTMSVTYGNKIRKMFDNGEINKIEMKEMKNKFNHFREYIKEKYPQINIIDCDLKIKSWECGLHGHIGINGSRANTRQYANTTNDKIIKGHDHTPTRINGVISVGTTSRLRLGYNEGPSSWGHANAIIHKNGKAQLIYINKSLDKNNKTIYKYKP